MRRRDFIRATATMTGGLAAGYVLNLSGCVTGDPSPQDEAPLSAGDVLFGLYASGDIASSEDAVRQALSRLDLGWLGSGDTVFVKLSCNSGHVHPAVTSPAAVTGLCAELFARGAGRVIVGDQAGVESVRLAEGDARFGSTRALMEENGLYDAIIEASAEPHFFDDQGYDAGYIEATPPDGHHWQEPLSIPGIVTQVDHIVVLPRLSSHALAGYTHGLKCAVGWLRDDSRFHMHNDAASMHEKYTEISYCSEIASRLRLVFTFAEQILLHQGPDTGTVASVDPRMVIASDDIANHDALSVALLRHFDTITQPDGGVAPYGDGSTADTRNQFFVQGYVENATGIPWGPGDGGYTNLRGHRYWEGIDDDLGLSRAYEIQGGVPEAIPVRLDGSAPAADVTDALDAAYDGLFEIWDSEGVS